MNDYYLIHVAASDDLTISTATPADGAGEFVNVLNPMIELYGTDDLLIVGDDDSGVGLNALISYPNAAAGTYKVRVYPFGVTTGEYVLTVEGATGTPPPFEVVSTDPADGAYVAGPPAQIVVDFTGNVLLTSIQATDLSIDAATATGFEVGDGDTVAFNVAPVADGTHDVQIAAGAILDLDGTPVEPYAWQFTIPAGPQVVFSSMQNGDIMPTAPLMYTARFNLELNPALLNPTVFQLMGASTGPHSPVTWSYDAATSTLIANFSFLPDDGYTLTLVSSGIQDLAGRMMDGETPAWPIPPNMSGDGVAGGDFVVTFSADTLTTAYPTPLAAKPPLGGLIYDPSASAWISAGDTDDFTLDVDAGQTITVVVDSSLPLQPEVELFHPATGSMGVVQAATPGEDAVFQTASATDTGTYTATVRGVGGTAGAYTVQVILNAEVEMEEHDGASNDTHATAQDIGGSFFSIDGVTATRGAVLGTSASSNEDWYSFWLDMDDSVAIAASALTAGSIAVELYDPPGALLAAGAGADNADQVITNFVAPADGQYRVLVTGDGAEYSLVVTRNAAFDVEPNDDLASAQDVGGHGVVLGNVSPLSPPIATETEPNDDGVAMGSAADLPFANDWTGSFVPIGGDDYQASLTGTISAGNDLDWDFFKIMASPGDTLVVNMVGNTLPDPTLRLYDNTGAEIAYNDDFGGLDSQITYNAFGYAGDYYVVADSWSSNTGSYTLTATLTTPAPLMSSGDEDYYVIYVGASDDLTISTATPADGAGAFVNVLDPAIELY
ncbi:MAG: Ig-like domain-containing protein, partial [Planctomycetota bacterium]